MICALSLILSACFPIHELALDLRRHPAGTSISDYNRLIFAGDVMFSRDIRRQILASGDMSMPFRKIAPLMAGADIAFVNLESPFSDQGPYLPGGLIFHAQPAMILGLQSANIAVVSTANNHARDCGPRGVEFTVSWLRLHHMAPLGSSNDPVATHAGVILIRNGIRFGFLGYTYDQNNGNWRDIDPRIAVANVDSMRADVSALRKKVDVVIVSMHHGIEYQSTPSKAQVEFAHAAIQAGATLVIGHHPHVIQPMERFETGEIFYSLGNFVFDQYQRQATQHGEVVQVSFVGRKILATHIMHVLITKTGPELEGDSLVDFNVSAELETHRREDFLGKRMFGSGAEAGEKR